MSEVEPKLNIQASLSQETKYGENPWQKRSGLYAVEADDPLAISQFELMQGESPSYNNYADIDRLLQTVTHVAAGFEKNFDTVPNIAAGAKHGNVCGLGVDNNEIDALTKMLEGDPRAIFGGSVMTNVSMGRFAAMHLVKHNVESGKRLLDVVAAPEFSPNALEILDRKGGKLRALGNAALKSLSAKSIDTHTRLRQVRGGFLAQENYDFVLDLNADYISSYGESANARQKRDMVLAWAIGSTSNSNTITLVKDGKLIGNGVGQQDRVSAAELAIKRAKDAGHDVKGATAYSDSFFPFPDGPRRLLDAGVEVILTSSGSVKDESVFDTITNAGATLYTLPDAAGRGFYAH